MIIRRGRIDLRAEVRSAGAEPSSRPKESVLTSEFRPMLRNASQTPADVGALSELSLSKDTTVIWWESRHEPRPGQPGWDGRTNGAVGRLGLAPVVGRESAELVDDVLEGDVGEGGGREGAGDKGDGVHCTAAGRQRRIGDGGGTRVPGEGGHAGRWGKAYRCEGGDAIVFRRHAFGQGVLCKWTGRGSTGLGSLAPEGRRTRGSPAIAAQLSRLGASPKE